MLSSKYVKDYRMDVETTKTGKVKRKMVYTGPLYDWNLSEDELRRIRRLYLILCVSICAIYLGSLLFYSNLSRLWYVILPYSCLILVLFFFIAAVYNIVHASQPMNRETKEKTQDRIKGSSLIGIVFTLGTFLGETYGLFKLQQDISYTDLLFIVASVFIFTILLYGFKASKRLQLKEKINPLAEEWKDK